MAAAARIPTRTRRTLGLIAGVVALVSAAAAPAGAQYASTPDVPALQTNGTVNSILRSTDRVYLGGTFSRVGFTTQKGFAALDPGTGLASSAFPQTNGTINAVVSDGAGGFYVGGTFTRIGAASRNRLAHITSTGAVGPFDPDVNESVHALLLSGNTLYAGGSFSQVNQNDTLQNRFNLAAFDTTLATGNATPFSASTDGPVYALAKSGDTLYAGGDFNSVSVEGLSDGSFPSQPRARLAAFDTTVDVDNATSFDPSINGPVYALALSGDTLYAGGNFAQVNANTVSPKGRHSLAAFDTTLATDNTTDFDPDVDRAVKALTLSGSTLYAGGDFTEVNGGVIRSRLAAFDTTLATANVTAFDPSVNDTVDALALSGSTLYAGGDFTGVNQGLNVQPRNGLAAFDTTTATDNAGSFDPDADGPVKALAVSGGVLAAGGSFTFAGSLGDAPRNNLAAVTVADNTLSAFNPNVNGNVKALALSGSTLYAGGSFTQVHGFLTRNRLAAFDAATGGATSFNPNLNDVVNALVLSGSTLYAGGGFTSVNGGTSRNRLAALNVATGTATVFNPSAGSTVNALALSGSTLYAGGSFTSVNTNGASKPRNRLAAFDTTTATNNATAFNPSLGGTVNALVLSGSTLYAGGTFGGVNINATAKSRLRLAAFDTTTAINNATPFDPGVDSAVRALALRGSTLYAGGDFDVASGKSRSRLAAFDTTTATNNATSFAPALSGTGTAVNALALGGAKTLYAGGSFAGPDESSGPLSFAQFSDPAVPTAAGWGRARVTRSGRRAVISWRAGSRADVAGYSVMRARRGSSRRVRITRKLILGGALSKRSAYRVVDRRARRGDRYFVREHTTSGRVIVHGPLTSKGAGR
jgi:hypothetical protein